MAGRKYYVLCEQNCKFESMTKEQILTAITQAVNEGTVGDVDTGFVSTVKTINGAGLRFFVGTQSEYEQLTSVEKQNLFAIITNDTTKEALFTALEEVRSDIDNILNGETSVPKAQDATNSQIAKYAKNIAVTEIDNTDGVVISETGVYLCRGVDADATSVNQYYTAMIYVPTLAKDVIDASGCVQYTASSHALSFVDTSKYMLDALRIGLAMQ